MNLEPSAGTPSWALTAGNMAPSLRDLTLDRLCKQRNPFCILFSMPAPRSALSHYEIDGKRKWDKWVLLAMQVSTREAQDILGVLVVQSFVRGMCYHQTSGCSVLRFPCPSSFTVCILGVLGQNQS